MGKHDEFIKFCNLIKISELPTESIYYSFIKDFPTRKLMSRLNHSAEKHIDILLIEHTYASLVIVSENNDLYRKCKHTGFSFSCTITELKKGAVSLYNLQLNKGIGKVLHRIDYDEKHVLEIWTKPGHIRAQTYADMDYRKEWYAGECYYEGNNYGDTSNFYMIGRIVYKK